MARFAIGGFQHETNTFSPHKADRAAFELTSAFPRVPRGAQLIREMTPLNVPIGGFIRAAQAAGHELLPTIWAMATPCAQVTDDAFDHITGLLLQDLKQAGAVDGIYLCLHGAMVTESHQDGEGELLRRVRKLVGPSVPLVVSLDLHSNTTEAMLEHSDALVAYRTYPHVDMAVTGERAAGLLWHMVQSGRRPAKALRKTNFLIPLVWQCTMIEPAASIYSGFDQREVNGVRSVSFTPGFPPADIAECGPAVFAYGDTQAAADAAADEIFAEVNAARAAWNGELLSPDEAITRAMKDYRGRPFVLADTQDNPGAGGASDTVGVLEALLRLEATDAVFACLYDPAAAAAAHEGGVGAKLALSLGASSGQPGLESVGARCTVQAVSDGNFVGTGPMSSGRQFRMGPTAVLDVQGVKVVVTSGRAQVLDQQMLRHIGIDPQAQAILAIKSSVHFRADFQAMAEEVLVVVAPGPNQADHRAMAYENLRPGLALMP